MHTAITACRMCGDTRLASLLDLGEQHLTGIFPRDPSTPLSKGPLELVLCGECGLVQLRHSYDLSEMYGPHYGYRSSLNRSMVEHLKAKIGRLKERYPVGKGDFVLDIGANDGTSLSFYPENGAVLCGMDPSAEKFREYYRPDINLVVDFFSAGRFRREFGQEARPKIITSIAMFYDLEEPLEFVRQIKEILHPQGVWHFEQSYLPLMLAANAYDTICHEHLEYYGLKQVKWMTDRAGLEIIDVETNLVNGGSFAVTVGHQGCGHERNDGAVAALLDEESRVCIASRRCYDPFRRSVEKHRENLPGLLKELKSQGKTVLGYGASTKGNVILQYCGVDAGLLPAIAEVNESKFGAVTPGTLIPIVSEAEARAMKPDYYLVLPWHFKDNIVEREREFLAGGGGLIFPLPEIEIVSG
jgi:SAM-dependent methyltransferase